MLQISITNELEVFVSRVLLDDGKGEPLTVDPPAALQSSFLCSCRGPPALFCAANVDVLAASFTLPAEHVPTVVNLSL